MANFNFNQVEFMQRVKEMRATWETLKRQAAKRCVEAKYDPKMNEEDRLESGDGDKPVRECQQPRRIHNNDPDARADSGEGGGIHRA